MIRAWRFSHSCILPCAPLHLIADGAPCTAVLSLHGLHSHAAGF